MSLSLVGSSVQSLPDADGWVRVERPPSQSEEYEESEGVWVVFSKEMGGEKFHVRLPNDPNYQYLPDGFQLNASLDADEFLLRVEKRDEKKDEPHFKRRIEEIKTLSETILMKEKISEKEKQLDLFYRTREKWVWERMIASSNYLYTFHTESPQMTGQTHRHFITSFEIF